MTIWSGAVPNMAATFSLMPLISSPSADFAGVRSFTSSATMAAPAESPTNRTPSGPNASGPADFSCAFPVCIVLAPNARNAAQQSASEDFTIVTIVASEGKFVVTLPQQGRPWSRSRPLSDGRNSRLMRLQFANQSKYRIALLDRHLDLLGATRGHVDGNCD